MKALVALTLLAVSISVFAQDHYDKARKHFHEDQLDSARYYINKTLTKRPTPDDYFLSGMIHEAQGKELRALADYEATIQGNPECLEAYFQKGLIYYHSASHEQAIQDFTHVILNHYQSPTNTVYFGNDPFGVQGTFMTTLQSMLSRVYQYRGLAYQKAGNGISALADFNKSFEYDTITDFFINRSQLYSYMGHEEQAKSDLRSALELDPKSYLAWYNLVLLDETARVPDYLLTDDEFSPMLNLLGANAYESGEYALAASYHTKALENDPEDELAYLNRGKSLLRINSYKQARADFLKAMQLNPNNVETFYLVGNSLFYEKKFADAIGFYERYLSVDRGYKNVWYNAAMAYLSIEKTDTACDCLQNAEKLGMEEASPLLEKHCESQ